LYLLKNFTDCWFWSSNLIRLFCSFLIGVTFQGSQFLVNPTSSWDIAGFAGLFPFHGTKWLHLGYSLSCSMTGQLTLVGIAVTANLEFTGLVRGDSPTASWLSIVPDQMGILLTFALTKVISKQEMTLQNC
jgi:hypothetical protein